MCYFYNLSNVLRPSCSFSQIYAPCDSPQVHQIYIKKHQGIYVA
nr:MAG TPA: hypothetical protein [Caudoviricetes sp.]